MGHSGGTWEIRMLREMLTVEARLMSFFCHQKPERHTGLYSFVLRRAKHPLRLEQNLVVPSTR